MGKSRGTAAAIEDEGRSRSDYFKGYYEENRERINGNRQSRYHTDPAYRQRVLESSQRYREKNYTPPDPTRIRRSTRLDPTPMKIGSGEEVEFYRVSVLAMAVKRSVQSITHWETNGVLPATPYKDNRGHRFYTPEMIRVVKEVVGVLAEDHARILPELGSYELIMERWVNLGVPMNAQSMKTALKKTRSPRKSRAKQDIPVSGIRRCPNLDPIVMKPKGGGVPMEFYRVSVLAMAVKRSIQSITHWESNGVLPATPYRDARGCRYYTAQMIVAVRDVISEVVKDRVRVLPEFGTHDLIKERWDELEVPEKVPTLKHAHARDDVGNDNAS